MNVNITDYEVDGIPVVALDGRIVFGEDSHLLHDKLKGMIASGKRKIVLNVDKVRYVDSAGLGELLASHLSAQNHGGSLRLCNLGSKLRDVLKITRLLTVFNVYDSEAEAVSGF